jgi:hypothetical protein
LAAAPPARSQMIASVGSRTSAKITASPRGIVDPLLCRTNGGHYIRLIE